MKTQTAKSELYFSDLLKFSFWRYLFRIIWLYFPAILFLLLSYACFWKLTQGKDLMVLTLENRDVFLYFILALIFWSYVTWYSTRLVGKAKEFEQPCEDRIWTALRVQGPRLLAFTCFTILIFAFFQLPPFKKGLFSLPTWLCNLFLLISIPVYFGIYNLWDRFTNKPTDPVLKRKFLKSVQTTTWLILAAAVLIVIIFKILLGLLLLLFGMQQALVLLLIIRRKLIEEKGESFYQQSDTARGFDKGSTAPQKTKGLLFDKEDRDYFRFFRLTSLVVGVIYFLTVFSVSFAGKIGTFPFIFIAFGVLLLLGNSVAFISVLRHFNFHILLVGLAFLIGLIFEPHYVQLKTKKDTTRLYSNRQDLKTYFRNWVNDPERKKILDDSSSKPYPVFFVLANGGASRSGYWVASVLSKLEDTTKGDFSKHLFCLSGASGGSVGNATFFNLLRSKNELARFDSTNSAFYHAATDYLESDFLTYTLARMLGPDVFRHIFPLRNIGDRASALAKALERSCGTGAFLYDSMATGFSEFMTQVDQPLYRLPILCINTTRMQDGSPAVISTISVGDSAFNKRLDVLSMLDEEKDIKLSSAVVLGASFPYISPAGRINSKVTMVKKDGSQKVHTEPEYFVDGGYFDNSGAGVVNEMIVALKEQLDNDTSLKRYVAQLQFYILHVSNDPIGHGLLPDVNPFTNDLAAPLKTLMGAYGSQTAINDLRLFSFMKRTYKNKSHYIDLNLYRHHERVHYSMNWVISDYLLDAMGQRLSEHENMGKVLKLLQY